MLFSADKNCLSIEEIEGIARRGFENITKGDYSNLDDITKRRIENRVIDGFYTSEEEIEFFKGLKYLLWP